MEDLRINADWGWNSPHGITPGGLVRLLQTCRLLSYIVLRLDTRGYIEVVLCETPKSLGLSLPPEFTIDVLDAAIEEESMQAIDTFFSGVAACCESGFSLLYLDYLDDSDSEYYKRWGYLAGKVSTGLQ